MAAKAASGVVLHESKAEAGEGLVDQSEREMDVGGLDSEYAAEIDGFLC